MLQISATKNHFPLAHDAERGLLPNEYMGSLNSLNQCLHKTTMNEVVHFLIPTTFDLSICNLRLPR